MSRHAPRKPIKWAGSAKHDLDAMPGDVKDVFGHAIDLAQAGGKHQDAKVMTGLGSPDVLEVVEDHRGDTFRAVYTVKLSEWVYVLHYFQKKSRRGIKTPKEDMDLIHARLRAAKLDFEDWQSKRGSSLMSRKAEIVIEAGGTNVYADVGCADAAEMQRKSQLAAEIAHAIKARRLTQQGAAELLGVDQSKVSRITRGQFRGVREAKLLELVTKLGHDVKIVVGPARRRVGKIELEFA